MVKKFAQEINEISRIIKAVRVDTLKEVEEIIHRKQFKGKRGYSEGCEKGIKAILKLIQRDTQ